MASVLRRFRRLTPPGGSMAGIAPPVDAEAARAAELASVGPGNIDAELLQTRRRLRRLERRPLPQLDGALAAGAQRLEENEREDILRLRRARGRCVP